jgi:GNAT superfamily N-acetyltransferase
MQTTARPIRAAKVPTCRTEADLDTSTSSTNPVRRCSNYCSIVQLTLWRDLTAPAPPLPSIPDDLDPVGCLDVSVESLGDLYYSAYQPPDRAETREAAIAEMLATLGGEYGQLMAEASPVLARQGQPVAVVQTVIRAPWHDVQDGPFVIELFTAHDRRGEGLGRYLLTRAVSAAQDAGEARIGLRVHSDNQRAVELYRALGFRES